MRAAPQLVNFTRLLASRARRGRFSVASSGTSGPGRGPSLVAGPLTTPQSTCSEDHGEGRGDSERPERKDEEDRAVGLIGKCSADTVDHVQHRNPRPKQRTEEGDYVTRSPVAEG